MYDNRDVEKIKIGCLWQTSPPIVPKKIIGIQQNTVFLASIFSNRTSSVSIFDFIRQKGNILYPAELTAKCFCNIFLKNELAPYTKITDVMIHSLVGNNCILYSQRSINGYQKLESITKSGKSWHKYIIPRNLIVAYQDGPEKKYMPCIWTAKVRGNVITALQVKKLIRVNFGTIASDAFVQQVLNKIKKPVETINQSIIFGVFSQQGNLSILKEYLPGSASLRIAIPKECDVEYIMPKEIRELQVGDTVRYIGNRINLPNVEHMSWRVLDIIKACDNRKLDQIRIESGLFIGKHRIVFRKDLRLINSNTKWTNNCIAQ